MLDDILAGIGGGLQGGMEGYTWAKQYQQKNKEIENRKEVQLLQQEIRLMLESMKEGGRNDRFSKPSGSVVAQQEGATDRTGMIVGGAMERAELGSETTRRGQDITEQLGVMRDGTTQRGQDLGFTLGGMRDTTTRRGQDIGATTTRRGQDITQQLGISTEAGRNTRATDVNALREQEIEQRGEIERRRRADPWGAVDFGGKTPVTDVKEGTTTKPTAQPIEVKETTGGLPVAPRSPEAAADQSQRLEQQASTAIARYRAEKDPAKKAALRNELTRLRAEILKAQQRPGGQ